MTDKDVNVGPYRSLERNTETERLLALAEAMQEKREQTLDILRTKTNRSNQTVGLGMLSAVGFGVYFGWFRPDSSATNGAIAALVSAVVALILAVIFGRPGDTTGLKQQLARDERALFDVVSILREAQASIAKEENWSPLQQAEFRIRLARFDIGPNNTALEGKGAWAPPGETESVVRVVRKGRAP
jgi:hypothetical protein